MRARFTAATVPSSTDAQAKIAEYIAHREHARTRIARCARASAARKRFPSSSWIYGDRAHGTLCRRWRARCSPTHRARSRRPHRRRRVERAMTAAEIGNAQPALERLVGREQAAVVAAELGAHDGGHRSLRLPACLKELTMTIRELDFVAALRWRAARVVRRADTLASTSVPSGTGFSALPFGCYVTSKTPRTVKATITFYGWPDNSPPGNSIAHPVIHRGCVGRRHVTATRRRSQPNVRTTSRFPTA